MRALSLSRTAWLELSAFSMMLCFVNAVRADIELAEIAAKGCTSARSLRTVDCQFQYEIGYYNRYVQDGTKYRIEYWKKGTFGQPDQRPDTVKAFDGQEFYRIRGNQFLSGAEARLVRCPSKRTPSSSCINGCFFLTTTTLGHRCAIWTHG